MNSWLFIGNFNADIQNPTGVASLQVHQRPTVWPVSQNRDEIEAGDEVFFWETGSGGGLVGWGTVLVSLAQIAHSEEEDQFMPDKRRFQGAQLRVPIRVEGGCQFSRNELLSNPSLAPWKTPQDTNLRI